MASVIPSVIVSLVTLAIILSILGSIVQYYSQISLEPAILPAYGSIYVEDVDPKSLNITIVNKYGYAVNALFSIRIVSNDPSIPPLVSFWRTILPGINYLNLNTTIRDMVGQPNNAKISIDLSNSYFIIGGLKYPIAKGAGLLKPFTPGSQTSKTFTASGIGRLDIFPPYIYATLYFTDKNIGISNTLSADFGYYRSIYNYTQVSVERRYEHGTVCDCYYTEYKHNILYNSSCITTSSYYPWCQIANHTRRYYKSYDCAYDGGSTLYSVSISSSISTTLQTIALYGATYFSKYFSKDSKVVSGGSTGYVTNYFPYIKPNQNECYYTYEDVTYTAYTISESTQICNECPTVSCYPISYVSCYQYPITRSTPNLWACGDRRCAGLDRYLYVRISNMYSNVTSLLTAGNKILLRFNLTYTFDYFFIQSDPELADSYIRISLNNKLGLSFPKIAGYLGIRYTDDAINSASVSLNARIWNFQAIVKTASGYSSTASLSTSVSTSSSSLTLKPIGYVAVTGTNIESAKTYRFETPSNMYVSLEFGSPSRITIPIGSSDTVYLTITFDLEITPSLTITVTGTQ